MELLVPLSLHRDACQMMIVGDVHQMGPHICNETAKLLGLGRSLMMDYLDLAVYMNVQYRVVSDDCTELYILFADLSSTRFSKMNFIRNFIKLCFYVLHFYMKGVSYTTHVRADLFVLNTC